MSDIENVRDTIHEINSDLGDNNTWQQRANEGVEDTTLHIRRSLHGRQQDFEAYVENVGRLLESYGGKIATGHRRATEILEQGHQDLQRLFDGAANDHARRGVEELAAAHQASRQVDAKIQAVKETYMLELAMKLQELQEALGAAANQLCVPFIGTDHLGSVTDITTMDWHTTDITCSDVAKPLRASHEATGKYLLEQFGVEPSE